MSKKLIIPEEPSIYATVEKPDKKYYNKMIEREYDCKQNKFRSEFFRDYTRIIHSKAFRRLRHKTQVFVHPANDHICTRLEHSLHVASISRTIATWLGLNTDLVEAIAIGHDLGHAPFGHEGENHLKERSKKFGLKAFSHELHSLRVVDYVESSYISDGIPGLNLTFAVRDGIACHYGETIKVGHKDELEKCINPDRTKKPDDLKSMERGKASPATLEGCVVRFADKVAYIGRDLEDALSLGIVTKKMIPQIARRVLGATNSQIIHSLIKDVVTNSKDQDCVKIGDEAHNALNRLYKFNMDKIYKSDKAHASFKQIQKAMDFMFDEIYRIISHARTTPDGIDNVYDRQNSSALPYSVYPVLQKFLSDEIINWKDEEPAQLAIDFIAGMTDSYFINSFKELFLPASSV